MFSICTLFLEILAIRLRRWCIPIVRGILVPVVHLFLQSHRSFVLTTRPLPVDNSALLRPNDTLAQLDIADNVVVLAFYARDGRVRLAQPLALEHALVVPAAQAQGAEGADDVGDDVVEVEDAAVGQEALQELGADAEAEGAHDEGEVQGAAAVGVDDPVEDDGEEEEGEQVQDLVVDVEVDLEGGQAGIACEDEQQEESAW